MALAIDKQRTALLCLHLQNDVVEQGGALRDFGLAAMVESQGVLAKIARLQEAAHATDVKVVHVAARFQPGYPDRPLNAPLWHAVVAANALVEGTWGAEFHPKVAPRADDVVVINKGTSAFSGSNLGEELASPEIAMLLLAGVATNFVVESTAREAADLGYEVAVVRDCCTSVSAEMQEAALNTALPFLAAITDSEEVIAVLSAAAQEVQGNR